MLVHHSVCVLRSRFMFWSSRGSTDSIPRCCTTPFMVFSVFHKIHPPPFFKLTTPTLFLATFVLHTWWLQASALCMVSSM
ncbi:hypothetical protein K402DRAFT_203029 [Aulographum hederae CBS 113979]|uniref:Uncharacterized protein n=1 Tax=Aulographum hederae CBS 113979 TaxID=1176131 RepID=A0A6G1HCH5_9PEZI|nr:hypothetical protein K402DRAFT_203029 [Aulographum hederae CBS 113979]